MKIEGKELTKTDIGKAVIYVPVHAKGDRAHRDCEAGHISSFNSTRIWVTFNGSTGQLCNQNHLVWA